MIVEKVWFKLKNMKQFAKYICMTSSMRLSKCFSYNK